MFNPVSFLEGLGNRASGVFDRCASRELERKARASARENKGTIYVNGVETDSIGALNPTDIVYIKSAGLKDIAKEALSVLRAQAPVVSGEYRNSFVALVDLSPVPVDDIDASVEEIIITNTTLYSRRLEVGHSADGTPFVVHSSPNIIEGTSTALAVTYAEEALITFMYVDLRNYGSITFPAIRIRKNG